MENIAHTLLGATLAKTRLGRVSPFAPAALVVAANLPDIENLVLAFHDHPTNMIHHRSVTHAVLGVAVLALLLALLVRGLEPWLLRGRPPGRFGLSLAGVGLASASHPLLDWLNTYGVRPWLPFDATRYHGDLVSIVDPWLWLLLGGAVCLAGPHTRAGSLALGLLGLALTALVLVAADFVPPALPVLWLVALAGLVLGRWRGIGRGRPEAVALAGLALAAAYVTGLGVAGRTAWAQSRAVLAERLPAGERIIAHTISPQLADPLRWQIVAETEQAVYRHTFSILDGPGGAVRLEKNLDDPLVQRVAGTPAGRAWRIFARHPVAAVVRNGRTATVLLLDARYPMFPARGFSSVRIDVPLGGPGS